MRIRNYFFYTKLFYKKSRLIRRPFYLRGKNYIDLGIQLTTGVGCRIEAISFCGEEKKLIQLGNKIQINDYVHIAAINEVIIEDGVLIASKVFISDHNHGTYSGENEHSCPLSTPLERKLDSSSVIIKKNVWIGESVSILPGVEIGEGSIIGSNSVINRDIPPYSIAVGIPAKVVKKYNFETNKWEKIQN